MLLSCFCIISFSSFSQRVVYPKNPYKLNFRNISYYNIIGKVDNNFLIFINTKFENNLRVYDHSMRLIKRTEMPFLPKRTLSVSFFTYSKFAWAMYSYQKRNIVYCMAAKMNEDGELLNNPIVLDSTQVNSSANNGVYEYLKKTDFYGFIRSEDQSKILIFKQQITSKQMFFSSMLYNNEMQLLSRHEKLNVHLANEYFSNFSVNNDGDWIFTGTSSRDGYTNANITQAQLFIQKNKEDSFKIEVIPLAEKFLDKLNLKIDNNNHNILVNSLYSSEINIEGLFTAVWNEENKKWETLKMSELGTPLRTRANANKDVATSLNDFYINQIILKNDGGFLVLAEERQSNYSKAEVINPYYKTVTDFWHEFGMDYNNIFILEADKTGDLLWGNVIAKKQKNAPGWSSFATILLGEEVHCLYNKAFKKTWLLENKSVTSDGKVIDHPLMRGLHDNYIFIPSRGRQTSEDEFIIPYVHKNLLSFAKIEF